MTHFVLLVTFALILQFLKTSVTQQLGKALFPYRVFRRSRTQNAHRTSLWMRGGVASFALLYIGFGSPGAAFAQTAHFTLAQSTIASGFTGQNGVEVDASGNIYIADSNNHRVIKETPSLTGYTQSTVADGGTLSRPEGLAIDGKGVVYIVDHDAYRILKEVPSGSGYTGSVLPISGLYKPSQILVATDGSLFISDSGNHQVLKEVPFGNNYVQTVVAGGSSLSSPTGLALDSQGTLLVSDFNNNAVYKETLSSDGTYRQSTIIASGLSAPVRMASSASGDLYIANYYGNRLSLETLSGGVYTQSRIPAANISSPAGIARDSEGNLFVSNQANGLVYKLQMSAVNFGSMKIGAKSNTYSLLFTFDSAQTLNAMPSVVTEGASNLSFVDAGTGTCKVNQAYSAGDTCTVDVVFSPGTAGNQHGAVTLKGDSGAPIASAYLYGLGVGPQVSFVPGVQSVVVKDLFNPRGITVDAKGNVYIADTDHNRVLKETLSGGTYVESVVKSDNLLCPIAVAVDGAGSVYIGDTFHSRILKETPSDNGSYTENIVVSNVAFPEQFAVNGRGDLFLTAPGQRAIVKETFSGVDYQSSVLPISGLSNPQGLALDSDGALYIADSGNQRVLKEVPSGGAYIETVIATTPLNQPRWIAVDASGSVYIADSLNGRIQKESPSGNSYAETSVITDLREADSVALDPSGNVYIADTWHGQILKENYANAPSLTFSSVEVGDTGDPQAMQIQSVGNLPLSFPVPASGANPAISNDFTLDSDADNACPQTGGNQGPAADLAPGATCTLTLRFAPTKVGAIQGDLVIGDTALNNPNAMQSISLNGTATAAKTSLILSALATAVYGDTVQVRASVASGSSQAPVSSGSVNFSDKNGAFGQAQSVANGVASQSWLPPAAGQFTLTASYTPANGDFNASTGQTVINITGAPLTITAANVTSVYGASTPKLTGSVVGAVNGDSFVEAFKTSADSTSPAGVYAIVPSVSGSPLSNYTANVQNGQLQITPAPLTVKANDVTRVYGVENPHLTGTLEGVLNNDQLNDMYTTTADASSLTGTYSITPAAVTGERASSYAVSKVNGTLTITAAPLQLSANNVTRAYGQANPSFTGTMSGAVESDQIAEVFKTEATLSSPPGQYPIVPSVNGATSGKYVVTATNGWLTITKAALTVTVDSATRAYGAQNPTFTGKLSGAMPGESPSVSFTTKATADSQPGSYPIVGTVTGSTAENYNVNMVEGTLTITKAGLTATANDATRVYGQANPTFTGTITGQVPGEALSETFSTAASAATAVGVYPVIPALHGPSVGDYTATLQPGKLTITPAPLKVMVNNATRLYGAANPELSGSVAGAVTGDVLNASYSTAATVTDAPGQYAITAVLQSDALRNYNVTQAPGQLTVVKASTQTVLSEQPGTSTSRTFEVHVKSTTSGVPTGAVRFFNGKVLLGEVALNNGVVSLSTQQLRANVSNPITAVYQGDTNFLPSSSDAVPVQFSTAGFWIKPAPGASSPSISSGEKAAWQFSVGPGEAGIYPGEVTFFVTGLPQGATAVFSPATLKADSGFQTITLTVQTEAKAAEATIAENQGWSGDLGKTAWALLLLPLLGARKMRRFSRGLTLLLLLVVGGAISGMLTGCGVTAGSAKWAKSSAADPVSYDLTVWMKSANQQQSIATSMLLKQK